MYVLGLVRSHQPVGQSGRTVVPHYGHPRPVDKVLAAFQGPSTCVRVRNSSERLDQAGRGSHKVGVDRTETRHNRPAYRHGWRGAIVGIPGASFRAVPPANPPGLVIRPIMRGVVRGQCEGGEMNSGVMGCCAHEIGLPVATAASTCTRRIGASLGPRRPGSNGPPGPDARRQVTARSRARPPARVGWRRYHRRAEGSAGVCARRRSST